MKHYILIPVCLLLTGIVFSQTKRLDSAQVYIKQYKIDHAEKIIQEIDTTKLAPFNKGRFYTILGKIHLSRDLHNIAFDKFISAKKAFTAIDSLSYVAKINLIIVDLLSHQRNTKISSKPFLDEYIQYSISSGKGKDLSQAYAKIAVTYLDVNNSEQAIFYFNKAISEAKKIQDTLLEASFKFNKGVVYNTAAKKYDSALYTFKKVLPIFKKQHMNEYVAYNYNNQAEAYKKLNLPEKAIYYYKKADSIKLRSYSSKTKKIFYENITDLYHKTEDYKNAFLYSQKLIVIKDSIDDQSQNNALIAAENKYRASEKEKLNLLLKTKIERKKQEQKHLFIGAIFLFILGAIITFLTYKNTKRKQHIAEQEKEIQIQKTEKILKEQELATIDAIISGK